MRPFKNNDEMIEFFHSYVPEIDTRLGEILDEFDEKFIHNAGDENDEIMVIDYMKIVVPKYFNLFKMMKVICYYRIYKSQKFLNEAGTTERGILSMCKDIFSKGWDEEYADIKEKIDAAMKEYEKEKQERKDIDPTEIFKFTPPSK